MPQIGELSYRIIGDNRQLLDTIRSSDQKLKEMAQRAESNKISIKVSLDQQDLDRQFRALSGSVTIRPTLDLSLAKSQLDALFTGRTISVSANGTGVGQSNQPGQPGPGITTGGMFVSDLAASTIGNYLGSSASHKGNSDVTGNTIFKQGPGGINLGVWPGKYVTSHTKNGPVEIDVDEEDKKYDDWKKSKEWFDFINSRQTHNFPIPSSVTRARNYSTSSTHIPISELKDYGSHMFEGEVLEGEEEGPSREGMKSRKVSSRGKYRPTHIPISELSDLEKSVNANKFRKGHTGFMMGLSDSGVLGSAVTGVKEDWKQLKGDFKGLGDAAKATGGVFASLGRSIAGIFGLGVGGSHPSPILGAGVGVGVGGDDIVVGGVGGGGGGGGGGGVGKPTNWSSVKNARTPMQALRGLGKLAGVGGLAMWGLMEAVSEMRENTRQEEKFQTAMAVANVTGGSSGKLQAILGQATWQRDVGDFGTFRNFAWKNEWNGQHAIAVENVKRIEMALAGEEKGQYGYGTQIQTQNQINTAWASRAGTGSSWTQTSREIMAKKDNMENARKLLYDTEVRKYGGTFAAQQAHLREVADAETIRTELGRAKESYGWQTENIRDTTNIASDKYTGFGRLGGLAAINTKYQREIERTASGSTPEDAIRKKSLQNQADVEGKQFTKDWNENIRKLGESAKIAEASLSDFGGELKSQKATIEAEFQTAIYGHANDPDLIAKQKDIRDVRLRQAENASGYHIGSSVLSLESLENTNLTRRMRLQGDYVGGTITAAKLRGEERLKDIENRHEHKMFATEDLYTRERKATIEENKLDMFEARKRVSNGQARAVGSFIGAYWIGPKIDDEDGMAGGGKSKSGGMEFKKVRQHEDFFKQLGASLLKIPDTFNIKGEAIALLQKIVSNTGKGATAQ